MTTLWLDGFDDSTCTGLEYDYIGGLAGGWTTIVGRSGLPGHALVQAGGSALERILSIYDGWTTLFTSIALKNLGNTNTPQPLIVFGSDLEMRLNTRDGFLSFYKGNVFLGGVAGFLSASNFAWRWLQVKVEFDAENGTIEVLDQDFISLVKLTALDTGGPCSSIRLANGTDVAFDDWHVWDTTGIQCNDWTFPTRVETMHVDGSRDPHTQGLRTGPLLGPWQALSEEGVNVNDYVYALEGTPIVNFWTTYSFSNLATMPPFIYLLSVSYVESSARYNSGNGTDVTNPTVRSYIFYDNSESGLPWTFASVNAFEQTLGWGVPQ